jgi:O-acetyl-ADP-ribose deacetylase (regulator of RNase III)
MEKTLAKGNAIRLMRGDITRFPADAIANAANSALRGGGGVDGAIHRAGGPSIMMELDQIRASQGGCPTGSAVATGAGDLRPRCVFHAVDPVYRDGRHGSPARERDVRTITFPSISTGVYGDPLDEVPPIALRAVGDSLQQPGNTVETATFVNSTRRPSTPYAHALAALD